MSVWGACEFGIPRADAHRAVPSVLGRRGHDPSERPARARAPGGRRSRRQRRAGAQRDGPRHLVRQSRRRIRCRTSRSTRRPGAEAEPRRDAHPGRSDRRGVSRRLVLAMCPAPMSTTRRRSPTAASPNAALVGKFLPQVPKHRGIGAGGVLRIRSTRPSRSASSSSACSSTTIRTCEFDAGGGAGRGGLRRRPPIPGLPGYAVVDLTASRDVGQNLEVFFGVQNLFDKV